MPGVVVYDEAGIFSDATEAEANRLIEAIEARTGAEIVVYTQTKPEADEDVAAADGQALGNQWRVGRDGFDDGLVILFDMQADGEHGAVRLEPGSGLPAAYLSEGESQAIFDSVMLPELREGNLDARAPGSAERGRCPGHRGRRLEARRPPGSGMRCSASSWRRSWPSGCSDSSPCRWYRYGRDPVYTDDPSVLMPAPPPGLSPAGATLLMAGRSTVRQFTTAMVDLAARGDITFRPEPGLDDQQGLDQSTGRAPTTPIRTSDSLGDAGWCCRRRCS